MTTALAQFSLDLGNGSSDPVPFQIKAHERHLQDALVQSSVSSFLSFLRS
jgi:hypothetical protein